MSVQLRALLTRHLTCKMTGGTLKWMGVHRILNAVLHC